MRLWSLRRTACSARLGGSRRSNDRHRVASGGRPRRSGADRALGRDRGAEADIAGLPADALARLVRARQRLRTRRSGRETVWHRRTYAGRLGRRIYRGCRARRAGRIVEGGSRVCRTDTRILTPPARLRRHPRGDRHVRTHAAHGDGLGQWVLLAARSYKSADIFAGVALLGAIGVVANAMLSLIEARALRWRTSSGS